MMHGLGVALSFRARDGGFVVDAVEFYAVDKTYAPFADDKLPALPLGIRRDWTGRRFVDAFGEPADKGGGMKQRMDIWLRWSSASGSAFAVEVQLDDRDWDAAKDTTWKAVTVYTD
ncbi:uncharacterized protein V1510DRAFT_412627 [Dipodascopsis tothii]|uniref:uncharacterized protein n=1 Tax=Dipodascopsis tothii TaxID=44089 RepID=UPI0034CD70FE